MSQVMMRKKGTQIVCPYDAVKFKEYGWYEMYEPLIQKETIAVKIEEEKKEIVEEKRSGFNHMNDEDKIQSIKNAIAIIPPNIFVNYQGRMQPKLSDVEAIVGFKMNSKMLQEALNFNIEE